MPINELKKFTGNYDGYRITVKNRRLIYTTSNGYATELSAINETTFTLNATLDNREVIFQRDSKGYAYDMRLNFDGNLSAIFIKR